MLCLQVVLESIVALLLVFWWKKRSFYNLANKIPGYNALQTLHQFKQLWEPENFYQTIIEAGRSFKTNFKLTFGSHLFVMLRDAEDVKLILQHKECYKKHIAYEKYFEDCVPMLCGDEYKLRKKLMIPVFSPSKLRSFHPIINERMRCFMKKFEANLTSDEFDEEFDILHTNFDFALDVLLCTVFGKSDVNEETRLQYIEDFEKLIVLLSEKMIRPWLIPPFLYFTSLHRRITQLKLVLNKFIDMLIHDLEEDYQAKTEIASKSVNYLTQIYQIRDTMSYQDIKNEIIALSYAGFDTVGISLSAVLLCLAMHPEVQDKVIDELNEIFFDDNDEEVDEEKMRKMIYLEMVVKEAMRLLPVNSLYGRMTTEDIQLTNFKIPAGTNISILTHKIHIDERYWGEDALKFNPDRFLPENIAKVHAYAYIPLSLGPRMCIAHRYVWPVMKTYLSVFLRKYRVSTSLKLEDITVQMFFTLRIKQGFMVKVETR